MLQITQNYKTGKLLVEEISTPAVKDGFVLVKTRNSLISAGTEKTKIETAKMSLIEKAVSRLDLVKLVLNNVKQEGIAFTLKKAFNKLNSRITLGYSCSGEVLAVGNGITDIKTGDRVAFAGEDTAAHSEINLANYKFLSKIPEEIGYEEAAFVGLGAIALNSVELAQTRNGETVAVIGLGLLGQITVQILKARGCTVIGIDIDDSKADLSKTNGAKIGLNPLKNDTETAVLIETGGTGCDAVIITAASKNSLPIELAGKISRNKGRVILVGVLPISIPRKEFYEKELIFAISRSFGCDLYCHEPDSRNYPFGYKPATVKRNIQEFLNLLANKKIQLKDLITHKFSLKDAGQAYSMINKGNEKYLGVIFDYSKDFKNIEKDSINEIKVSKPVNIGFIGAGSFAQGYILPMLKKNKNSNLVGVATSSGVSSKNAAEKFGFSYATAEYENILNDKSIDTVYIMTRHNLHAPMIEKAIEKGKNIFVEKPLCLNIDELKRIILLYKNRENALMVGFNRRFAPLAEKTKEFFSRKAGPLQMIYRINAGHLPADHWILSKDAGGGRIVGEICHFVDLLQYFSGSHPEEIFAFNLKHGAIPDSVSVSIKFKDGSSGSIEYSSVGDISFPRERVEIMGDGSVAVIENFKEGIFTRLGSKIKKSFFSRDMGYAEETRRFINMLANKEKNPLIPFEEIVYSTLATFAIEESIKNNKPVKIEPAELRVL